MRKEFLLIGKIVNTHGIKGKIRVIPYADSTESFRVGGEVFLKQKSGPLRLYHLRGIKSHKKFYILSLAEIDHINEAETLIGANIYIKKSSLPPLNKESEYYWYQVLGLKVCLKNAEKCLGKIKYVFNTGSNDIFVVHNKKEKKEYLIPSIEDVIEKFDWTHGVLWIKPMPGLLE
ncbi:MAG TPA: 16S rRNA processing protein RimM [Candidatus Desulfofervidus auxilii]|uniref:Ribosome maturation factor RimM n=1 Tax=Desulfofervidus auxilii TaxID=1621989 RepID=A0A7C1W3N6_DESA2|nr:16S rRNA processing protein RimM [Candidatus Desulfofervidus auxilii]